MRLDDDLGTETWYNRRNSLDMAGMNNLRFRPTTTKCIREIFSNLDYKGLGSIYCEEGGEAFWKERRKPCENKGITMAKALKALLSPTGRSLYVGAGVAEIPCLVMERLELGREVFPYNLRKGEVAILNRGCQDVPLTFFPEKAESAPGQFDHLWMVSVLNDPERFPELSSLSYNRADPIRFNPTVFKKERDTVFELTESCMMKLTRPALVSTSVEEQHWISHWCETHRVPFIIHRQIYPTALVGDPVCFIQIG